jgi:hypothetical protein
MVYTDARQVHLLLKGLAEIIICGYHCRDNLSFFIYYETSGGAFVATNKMSMVKKLYKI